MSHAMDCASERVAGVTRLLFAFVVTFALSGLVFAQQEPEAEPETEESTEAEASSGPKLTAWIVGRIVTGTGVEFRPGVLLEKDGKIEAIGAQGEVLIPTDAVRKEHKDAVLYPGFVAAASLQYTGANSYRTSGTSDQGDRPVTQGLSPSWAGVEEFARSGFTTALVLPVGGGLAGRAAIVRPLAFPEREPYTGEYPKTEPKASDYLRVDGAALAMGFARGTRNKKTFQDAFDRLKKYLAEKEAFEKAAANAKEKKPEPKEEKPAEEKKSEGEKKATEEKKPEDAPKDGEKKAEEKPKADDKPKEPKAEPKTLVLVEHFEGRLPAVLSVDSAADFLHFAPFFAAEKQLRPTLFWVAGRGGPDIERVIDEVTALAVPVVLSPSFSAVPRTSTLRSPVRELLDRGVAVALVPSRPRGSDLLDFRTELQFLAWAGIPEAEILRAVTLTPAEILGVQDRVGSLEKGKEADFLMLDGELFRPTTRLVSVVVAGGTVFEAKAEEDL